MLCAAKPPCWCPVAEEAAAVQERFDHHCAVRWAITAALQWQHSWFLGRTVRAHGDARNTASLLRGSSCAQVVGNCIALRNHRFFVALLFSGQVGCLLLTGGASWKLRQMGFPS